MLAERGFDPRTSGLWAQHASTAPLCYRQVKSENINYTLDMPSTHFRWVHVMFFVAWKCLVVFTTSVQQIFLVCKLFEEAKSRVQI